MKNLTLLLFVSCFLYSQQSKTENKIYHIITTDNDTINVTSYRIGHSLLGSVCEFKLLSGKFAKGSLKAIKKIEDSNGNELYPRGGIKEVKKPITQIGELKYKRSSAGAFIALDGVVGIAARRGAGDACGGGAALPGPPGPWPGRRSTGGDCGGSPGRLDGRGRRAAVWSAEPGRGSARGGHRQACGVGPSRPIAGRKDARMGR